MSQALLVHAVMRGADAGVSADVSIVDGAPLVAIAHGPLAALATPLPQGAAETLLADSDRAAAIAVRHNAVLTAIAEARDVLPVRLGAAFADESAVRAMLAERAESFVVALEHVSGAVEFGVSIAPVQKPGAPAPAAAPVASGRDFLRRKAEVRAVRAAGAAEARAMIEDAFALVSREARAHAPATSSDAAAGKATAAASLLVPRDRVPALDAAVRAAQDVAARAGYRLSVVGPFPPYSFAGSPSATEAAA